MKFIRMELEKNYFPFSMLKQIEHFDASIHKRIEADRSPYLD